MIRYVILNITLFSFLNLSAQDTQFSQYFNIPNYMNPSLVGSGSPHVRGVFHSRAQWPGLETQKLSNILSLEKSLNGINSGVGVYFLADNYSKGTLKKHTLNFQYAYTLDINDSYSLKTGISAGFISYKKSNEQLLYPDQYDSFGLTGATSQEPIINQSTMTPDLGLGVMLYGDQFWFGLNAQHLNRPNLSFYNDQSYIYPVKFSVHAGAQINLSETKYNRLYHDKIRKLLFPVFNYKRQGKYDQYETGLYGIYNVILAGIYYRGIPLKRYEPSSHNHESVILQLGYNYHNQVLISYSYDIVLSHLAGSTGGAHEINITLSPVIPTKFQKKKTQKRLPCPAFIQAEW